MGPRKQKIIGHPGAGAGENRKQKTEDGKQKIENTERITGE